MLAEQRERYNVLRQKAELLSEAPDADGGRGDDCGGAAFTVGDDEVEVALLAERGRRVRQ